MMMPDAQLSVAALGLARGGGSQFLERMLVLATDHMGADGAVLMAHRDDRCDILCSVGLPLSASAEIDKHQFASYEKAAGRLLQDSRQDPDTMHWSFVKTAPYWQSFRPLMLDVKLPDIKVLAIFGSHQRTAPRAMREPPPFFGKLIVVLHDLFSLITEIADLSNRPMVFGRHGPAEKLVPAQRQDSRQYSDSDRNVVERFLLDTLIQQPRVLSRGNVSYHAIRRWRRSVKPEQISALKAIKQLPSDHFEVTIAEEMASWCRRAFGGTAFANVVAVPCGHSGRDCLARRIGQQVASLLSVNFVDAFEPLQVTGSSHPKTNVKRPKMKLATIPVGPILLVDDVATSGSHIEEATLALREHDLAVTSIAWIAAG
jgi:hypothetical protein